MLVKPNELRGKTADKLHQGLPNYIFNSRPLFSASHQIKATLSRIGISSTSPQIVATNKGLIAPYHVEWFGGHCKKKGFGKENLIRKILLVLFLWVRLRLTQRCVAFCSGLRLEILWVSLTSFRSESSSFMVCNNQNVGFMPSPSLFRSPVLGYCDFWTGVAWQTGSYSMAVRPIGDHPCVLKGKGTQIKYAI